MSPKFRVTRRLLFGLASVLALMLVDRATGDSLNIRLAGEWPFSGLTSVIGVASRNLAFVGSGGGVYVLDISNPDTPQVLSMKIQTLGTVNDLFYEPSTQRLYVAGQQGGLSIWDVSTATNPVRLGVCRTPSQAYRVAVSGGYAYIADRDSGLRIISVTNPVSPFQVGRYDTPGDAEDIAVSGLYAYVGDSNCLRVLNVSDPANPVQVGVCDTILTFGIAQADSFVYVASGYALIVVNVANPAHPYRMGSCPPMSNAVDVALRSHYAYVADDMFGYLVMDVSDPWNPHETGGMGGGGRSWVRVSDTLAFFIGDDVDICNAADSTYPHEVGSYSPLSLSGSCAVCGQYAYVGSDHDLLVFDISDVQNPRVVDSCPVGAAAIALQNQYAYVTWGNLFAVLDISAPTQPREVGRCSFRDGAVDVSVSGTLACVLGQNSVQVVDLFRPDSPFVVGSIDGGGFWGGIVLRDSLVYTTNFAGNHLQVISVSDPAHPVELGSLALPDIPVDLALLGTFAYVADFDSGLVIADVTDPTHPVEVGEYPVPGKALHVSALSGCVYVAGYWTTLRILDVSNPSSPTQIAFYDNFGVAQNIVPVGRYIYVAGSGLHIYENLAYGIEEPRAGPIAASSTRLLENPVRGREIALEICSAKYGTAAFRLFNVVGEQVKQYRLTGLGSRTNVVRLPVDGLAAGLYLLRTNEPQNHCGIKVVIGK